MRLLNGIAMCDVDGCVSTETQLTIMEYSDGSHLCEWHTYLTKEDGIRTIDIKIEDESD